MHCCKQLCRFIGQTGRYQRPPSADGRRKQQRRPRGLWDRSGNRQGWICLELGCTQQRHDHCHNLLGWNTSGEWRRGVLASEHWWAPLLSRQISDHIA